MEMIRIQEEDFDIKKITDEVRGKYPETGGVVSFLGTTRSLSRGENIEYLEFEHYAGMAEKQLAQIRETALQNFDVLDAFILHRVGKIPVGDNIVFIVVASQHRAAAFDACEYCIDELKRITPIWKKETSTTGAQWVEYHP